MIFCVCLPGITENSVNGHGILLSDFCGNPGFLFFTRAGYFQSCQRFTDSAHISKEAAMDLCDEIF